MGFWFAGLYQDWLSGVDALIIGAAVAAIAPVGDLFESMLKRDLGIKDTGTPLRPPRRPPRPPRRGPLHDRRRLLPLRRSSSTEPVAADAAGRVPILSGDEEAGDPRLDRVDRDAGAGDRRRLATSSQVVGLAAGIELGAARRAGARARRPTVALADPDAAERARERLERAGARGRGGVRELIAASGADLVLNGIVGAAGPRPDDRRAHRGDRRRARQQGEPGDRRRAGDGAGRGDRRAAAAGRLRALGALPADRRRARRARSSGSS